MNHSSIVPDTSLLYAQILWLVRNVTVFKREELIHIFAGYENINLFSSLHATNTGEHSNGEYINLTIHNYFISKQMSYRVKHEACYMQKGFLILLRIMKP